jgi:hypothetical protein
MPEVPTGQTVRAALLAAGFPEWSRDAVSGFHIGEGDTEVLVEYQRGNDAGTPYTEAVKTVVAATLDGYSAALTAAGFGNDRAWRTHGPWLIVIRKVPAPTTAGKGEADA